MDAISVKTKLMVNRSIISCSSHKTVGKGREGGEGKGGRKRGIEEGRFFCLPSPSPFTPTNQANRACTEMTC